MKEEMARAFAGPRAANIEVIKYLYSLDKFEWEFWWGPDNPFMSFDEWLVDQVSREANPEKSCEKESK